MRLPLPSHIRLKHAFIFASCLLFAQQAEGTDLNFSLLSFAFIMISAMSFNAAGGLVYPTGAFVFFNAMLTAIVGISYKVLLGEPGQSNLRTPNLTMLMYCGGMIITGTMASLARKFSPKRPPLSTLATGEEMKYAAIASFVLGAIIQLLSSEEAENGSLLAALRQINVFIVIAVVLATFYQVRKSGGTRSSNWVVWVAALWAFFFGILSTSKERILLGPLCWVGAALAAGHNFTRKQVACLFVAAIIFQVYLVPYSQVSRNYRPDPPSLSGDAQVAWRFLRDPQNTRDTFVENEREVGSSFGSRPHFYDSPQGFFDRLNMLAPDDALTAYTANGGDFEGLLPTYDSLLNIIPHFVWKDKPIVWTGNRYAREIGMISDVNEATGVSFSPAADAYHQVGWYGIFLLLPLVLLFLFVVMEYLGGDVRQSPWALLFSVICAHQAPEGMISGQIYVATYAAFGVVLVALSARYIFPLVGKVLINAERTRVHSTMDFRPVLHPRSLAPASPAPDSTPPDMGT